MTAEREALKLVLFPTEVSSFDFQVECTDRTVQNKLDAQSLRLSGLHRDVNDASRRCESSPKQNEILGPRSWRLRTRSGS